MNAEDVRALLHDYAAAWGRRDRAGWLATFSTTATQEDPVGEGVREGVEAIGGFWDSAMAGYDSLEIRVRGVHVSGAEAALEWTIVARAGSEWVSFDGVDVFMFTAEPLIASVRAFWERDGRRRSATRPK